MVEWSLSQLREFFLISLEGSLCKLMEKVLAAKLAKLIDKLISPNQIVFLKGMLLVDGGSDDSSVG